MSIFIEQTNVQPTLSKWATIKWGEVEKVVRRLQERIYRASQRKEWNKVRSLQNLLKKATSTRLKAIRQVTQQNQGRKTPGIDGLVYDTPTKRLAVSVEIEKEGWQRYRPQAVKRIYIPKGETKLRPLGIPTIKDRIRQSIIKMVIEPEWEARFEANSYGFRPGRSTQDAIAQIQKTLIHKGSSQWILDADIEGCFDNIAHPPLIQKLAGVKTVVRKWLKAGLIEKGHYYPSAQGTPQGGIISPLLANIALDGMERLFGSHSPTGRYLSPALRKGQNKGITLIRYADDFIVTAPSKQVLTEYVIPTLENFLAKRGLKLNALKTRIVHISEGFNFLGFTITAYKHKLLITPQKEKVQQHLTQVKAVLTNNRHLSANDIINHLNPIIRGWTNYYRYFHASKTFKYLSYRYWLMLWRWVRKRHPNKSRQWLRQRYFKSINNRHWVFSGNKAVLLDPGTVHRLFYRKVQSQASPFDPQLRHYWLKRHSTSLLQITPSTRKRQLLKKQRFRCSFCKQPFLSLHNIVLHHILPRSLGGSYHLDNLIALHSYCHIQHHQLFGLGSFKA